MHFLFSKIQNQMREKKILYIYMKKERNIVCIYERHCRHLSVHTRHELCDAHENCSSAYFVICVYLFVFPFFFCGSAAFLHSLSLSHTIRFGFSFVCLRIGIAYNIHIYNYYDCFFRLVSRVIGHSVFMNITSQKKEKWFEHQIQNMHKR